MILGIAATAMPFARTSEAEAERWLRVLRLYGQVGTALQALGVSEQPLPEHPQDHASQHADGRGGDAVTRVAERAVHVAGERGSNALATTDVLVGVMDVYGEDFDRVLRAHGTDRDEVLDRLGLTPPPPAGAPR